MKRQKFVLFSILGALLLLFSLPINSRADVMSEKYAGPLNSFGNGAGWLVATQAPSSSFQSAAVLSLSGQGLWTPASFRSVFSPVTSVGRPRFGLSYWGWSPSVWTGTSYTYYDSDDADDGGPDPTSAPEPGTILLMGSGLLGLLLVRRFAGAEAS